MSGSPSGVLHEHEMLCRHLGSVQNRVSRLMQETELALIALTSEVVRLRGQLVLARTSLLWGMSVQAVSTPPRKHSSSTQPVQTRPAHEMDAARKAICQTGCAGHAHPWLMDDGQCRLSGRVCDGGGD